METLYIRLHPTDNDLVELRYWREGEFKGNYKEQTLDLNEIQQLLDDSERDYYVLRPNLKDMGQVLFQWLDGSGRWLDGVLRTCPPQGLVLAIDASERLANLPWEVLHDGNGFLVDRFVVPVRWVDETPGTLSVRESGLQVLFMATSPEGVKPVLDFEREEAQILDITKNLPLQLRVEESGCVKLLGTFWRRFAAETFDIFHLTGHGDIHNGQPIFVTESDTGERLDVGVSDLVGAFQRRFPRLAFLSGCRTGQGDGAGTFPSMAEAMVREGVPAVLGWGRPIGDRVATDAAGNLYERLAEGDSIAAAVGSTYQFLRGKAVADWHLLRLVARSDAWGQITQAPGDYYPAVGTSAQEQFLDPKTQDVRVATAAEFVGRRRLLQRGLRQLRQGWGLMLHGLGGVGKSTVAARLLERLQPAGYEPVVMYRQLDEQKLLRRLSARQSELGQQCLQSDLPLEQRLTQFLARGLVEPDRKLCFILDDFEANIELRADGQPILKSAVVETLTALLQGLKRANKPHRLILTSRYDVTFPVLDGEIEREELAALQGAELEKKCQRLDAFSRQSQVAPELQAEARTAADGNPRLLEWLDKVLRELQGNVAEEILERVKAEEERFREEILAAALLEKQSEALKTILARGSIFRLPVPEAVMQEVWAIVSDAQALQQRAVALGLLEVSQRGRTRHLRVPQILQPLLPTTETDEDLWKVASDLLYRAWWEVETRTTEEQVFELLRLAEGAQQPERAAFLGNHIALRYEKRGRYREAIPLLQHALQIREEQLGASHPDTASSLNNLALLYDSTGKYAEAEPLYLRVLQIREEQLGASHPDTATSLNNLAGLYKSTGKYAEAEPLYLRALQIREEQLGASHPDTATSLNNLALLYDSTGKYAEAEPLYLRTIAIFMAALGENHPNTQTVFNNYVEMLQEAIEAGKAQEMLESGSDITRQILTQMLSADS